MDLLERRVAELEQAAYGSKRHVHPPYVASSRKVVAARDRLSVIEAKVVEFESVLMAEARRSTMTTQNGKRWTPS